MQGNSDIRRTVRLCALAVAAATAISCNDDPTSNDTPYVVVPVTTAALAGTPGRPLADTLVVEVRTADGEVVPGATVQWSLPQGGSIAVVGASLNGATSGTTDSKGRSYALWTLGLPEGQQQARVAVGLGDPATFTATARVLHAKQITVGASGACAILLDDQPVCWGGNFSGELGNGDSAGAHLELPTPVPGLPQALEIRMTNVGLTCARDMAGDVWCWGRNYTGEAGPAAAKPIQLTPVRVPGAEGASSVAPSSALDGFACATFPGVGIRCWGSNSDGQLGTGDFVSSSSPRQVVGSAGLSRVAVGGWERSCALDGSGEVWCWGRAEFGELAPLPDGVYPTPVQPVPGHKYFSLAAGAYAVCGIQVDGAVSCFGEDFGSFGRVPLTLLEPGDAPVGPVLPESMALLVTDGWNATYGRSRYGLGYVWGEPGCCDIFVIPPAMITPSIRVTDIAASSDQYCVLGETGAVYCGRPNSWFEEGGKNLSGVPDTIGP